MDKNKLFDKLDSEQNHYCRFICDNKELKLEINVQDDEECESCENMVWFSREVYKTVEMCEHCKLKDFVETLKREIQVDKL